MRRITILFLSILFFINACSGIIDFPEPQQEQTDATPLFPDTGFSEEDVTIDSIEPSQGSVSGGIRVTIHGEGFKPKTTVLFGHVEGLYTVVENENTIKTTTPPMNPGFVDVKVIRPDGRYAILKAGFLYKAPVDITEVQPEQIPTTGGVPIVIKGKGFNQRCTVLVGGQLAVDAHVTSSTRIDLIAPSMAPGRASIAVSCPFGEGHLRKGVLYVSRPKLYACSPAKVIYNKENCVVITGSGLDFVDQVVFAKKVLADVVSQNSTTIKACFNPDKLPSGGVEVTLKGTGGSTTGLCFIGVKQEHTSNASILGMIPSKVLEGQSTHARVVFSLPKTISKAPSIYINGQAAFILKWLEASSTAVINLPALNQGVYDISSVTPFGKVQLNQAITVYPAVKLTGVKPLSGPIEGNQKVTIHGSNLDKIVKIYFGVFPARILKQTSKQLEVITPPGEPGRVSIRAVNDYQEVLLPSAYSYTGKKREVKAIYPQKGSIAGGTMVTMTGSGFTKDMKVFFGDQQASLWDQNAISPSQIVLRTPPVQKEGPVDVRVIWPDKKDISLPKGFVYFDPMAKYGGNWGEAVEDCVNVGVKNASKGRPVPNAAVVVQSDNGYKLAGTTDERGLVTLCKKGLRGPLQVTAGKKGFNAATITGVDAENISLLIQTTQMSQGGGGGGGRHTPDGLIYGRVVGIDKGLLIPPGSCQDVEILDSPQCEPCNVSQGCGSDDYQCSDAFGRGWYCLKKCKKNSDCPDNYACYNVGYQNNACLPVAGKGVIKCYVTSRGPWGVDNPGPGYEVGADGSFKITSRPGMVAVYCIGGVKKNNDFIPLALGIKRGVSVTPQGIVEDVNVPLNIPLGRTLTVKFNDLPQGKGQPWKEKLELHLYLGSDGYISLWPVQTGPLKSTFTFHYLPTELAGPLQDAQIKLYFQSVYPGTSLPESRTYKSLKEYPKGYGLYVFDPQKQILKGYESSFGLDVVAACKNSNGHVYLFDSSGFLYDWDPYSTAINTMPFPYGPPVMDCVQTSGNTLVAGAGHGVIWINKNNLWQQLPSGIVQDIDKIACTDDFCAAMTTDSPYVILLNLNDFSITTIELPQNIQAAVVRAINNNKILIGTDDGHVATIGSDGIEDFKQYYGLGRIVAIEPCNNTIYLLDSHGTLLDPNNAITHHLPDDLKNIELLSCMDNNKLFLMTHNKAYLLNLENNELQHIPGEIDPGFLPMTWLKIGDKYFIAGKYIVNMPPVLWSPEFSQPSPWWPWSSSTLRWHIKGTLPHFINIDLSDEKGGLIWRLFIRGDINHLNLPDLSWVYGDNPIQINHISFNILSVLFKNFDFNDFDMFSISTQSWQSWNMSAFDAYRGN